MARHLANSALLIITSLFCSFVDGHKSTIANEQLRSKLREHKTNGNLNRVCDLAIQLSEETESPEKSLHILVQTCNWASKINKATRANSRNYTDLLLKTARKLASQRKFDSGFTMIEKLFEVHSGNPPDKENFAILVLEILEQSGRSKFLKLTDLDWFAVVARSSKLHAIERFVAPLTNKYRHDKVAMIEIEKWKNILAVQTAKSQQARTAKARTRIRPAYHPNYPDSEYYADKARMRLLRKLSGRAAAQGIRIEFNR